MFLGLKEIFYEFKDKGWVAITVVPSQIWQGGFNYQFNLCKAISTHFKDKVVMIACFEKC